jgi:hypothetical protein
MCAAEGDSGRVTFFLSSALIFYSIMGLKGGSGRMITHEEQGATLESTDTGRTSRVRLQTFRHSFEEICAEEAPWIPLEHRPSNRRTD